jgi:indole-3-glycerol phosphate synthase
VTNILDRIIATKKQEVAARRSQVSLTELRRKTADVESPRGFAAALHDAATNHNPGVIAEIKKASPSKGVIREDFRPQDIARSYASHGATCLSVLTDEQYFQGSDAYLTAVHSAVSLPIIRKDFTIDEYQIVEARALGADAILLIVAALNIMQLTVLNQAARDLGLDVLIEVHNELELDAALSQQPKLIGINNRNLKTFETNLSTTIDLLDKIPDGVTVVTESGISSPADIRLMREHDVHCFLIGEAFMRAADPGAALEALFS